MTKEIQTALCKYLSEKGHEHLCENFGHIVCEMDVASLSKSDMLLEFEVKISRSDFLADKNKRKKYGISKFEMYSKPFGHEARCPNYFYYVCPENLISKDEIPLFAGLFYYNSDKEIVLIKSPKRIHKVPSKRVDILNKMLRMVSQRKYLGGTMLTYKNNLIKERYKNAEIRNVSTLEDELCGVGEKNRNSRLGRVRSHG